MNAPHPGIVLLNQYLRPMAMSQNGLARRIGVPPRRINEIILGKRAVSADSAIRLAACFGNSPGYWMGLQADYDIQQARQKLGDRLRQIDPLDTPTHTAAAQPALPQRRIRRRIMR